MGIPLPGTGAWTGSLIAALLDVDFKKAVICLIKSRMNGIGMILPMIHNGIAVVIGTSRSLDTIRPPAPGRVR